MKTAQQQENIGRDEGSRLAEEWTKAETIVHARAVWLVRGLMAAGVPPHAAQSVLITVNNILSTGYIGRAARIEDADRKARVGANHATE